MALDKWLLNGPIEDRRYGIQRIEQNQNRIKELFGCNFTINLEALEYNRSGAHIRF